MVGWPVRIALIAGVCCLGAAVASFYSTGEKVAFAAVGAVLLCVGGWKLFRRQDGAE